MILYYHKLLYLLPIALTTGSFFSDLIVVVCTIFFLIDTFRLKLFKYYDNYFFKIFIIFFFLINLSSLFSGYTYSNSSFSASALIKSPLLSFKYSVGYLRYGIFSIFLYYVLKNFSNFKYNFSYIIFIVFIFLIIDGHIQFFFGNNLFLLPLEEYRQGLPFVTSVFGEEKKLGSFLSRLAPIFLISILFIKEKFNIKINLLVFMLILLLYSTILLTTERSSIFLISSLLAIVYLKSEYLITSKNLFFIILLLFLVFVLYINPNLFEKIKSVFYSSGIMFSGQNPDDGAIIGGYEQGTFFFSKYHHDRIIESFNIFKDNLFFGIGAKNFNLYTTSWHPHNFHAQIIAEIGIFGYLVLFSVFAFLSFEVIKIIILKKTDNCYSEMKIYIMFGILLSLLPIPNGDFFNNWLNIIIYLPVGFLLFLNEKKI